MPKRYVHTKRGPTMKYENAAIEEAVKAVNLTGMSITKASETFGIPRSTIGDRISGKHTMDVQHGRPPAVPASVEAQIVNTVKVAARMGVGLSRGQVLLRTNTLCKRLKICSSYSNFHAGKDWWEGVKRRHPDIVIRKPEKLTAVRARMLNGQVVEKYFNDLSKLLTYLNLTKKAHRVWNCDETGLNFEHVPVRVVAEKGERSVVSKTSSKSSNITVMACVSATGVRMPPMLIAKGKTTKCLHGFNTKDAPSDTLWTFQKNGWMTDEVGERWFNDVFLKNCGPERPQLLILDGHSSHESLAILERAIEENITILSLPPHCTHYLQPLDRSVFGPLKSAYNASCSSFMQEHPLHVINKWTFPSLLRESWDKAVTPVNIASGFLACGIVPFNRNAIPAAAFTPSNPTDVPAPADTIASTVTGGSVDGNEVSSIDPELHPTDPAVEAGATSEYFTNVADASFQSAETLSALDLSLPILDLSDPTVLRLLENGQLFIDNVATTNSIPESPTSNVVHESVSSIFLPEKIQDRPTNVIKKKTNVTGHRLLTSQDIVNQKRAIQDKKDEKENRMSEKRATKKLKKGT